MAAIHSPLTVWLHYDIKQDEKLKKIVLPEEKSAIFPQNFQRYEARVIMSYTHTILLSLISSRCLHASQIQIMILKLDCLKH